MKNKKILFLTLFFLLYFVKEASAAPIIAVAAFVWHAALLHPLSPGQLSCL